MTLATHYQTLYVIKNQFERKLGSVRDISLYLFERNIYKIVVQIIFSTCYKFILMRVSCEHPKMFQNVLVHCTGLKIYHFFNPQMVAIQR